MNKWTGRHQWWQLGYGFAFMTVALSLGLTLLLLPVLNRTPTALFFAAVMLSSWYRGFRAGIFATILSVLAVNYLLLPIPFKPSLALTDVLLLGIFGTVAVFTSWLNGKRIKAELALKRAKEELEIRVAERTKELQQINEQLQSSEERYRQLVELSPDAIFLQSGGQFIFVNSAAVKLYGVKTSSELLGQRVLDWVHPDYRAMVNERIQQLNEGKPVGLLEKKIIRFDGTAIDVEGIAVPFTYQNQPAAQVIIRDISLRKRAEEELHQALEKEREFSELKSRLVSTISHEYRTPLTVIQTSVELLEKYDSKLTEQRKTTHFQRIKSSIQYLTNLVSDVLFISKSEVGKLEFNPVVLNLEQCCQELVDQTRSSANSQTSISFTCNGDCTEAYLDETLLRQILTNLLSNAIKYSPQGSTVQFDLECTVSSTAQFRIQDYGIGIPAEDLPRLFESFHRGSNIGTISGTGLGFAIVKKCVDLHKGQITVESEVGVGTTVTVTLPLNPILLGQEKL